MIISKFCNDFKKDSVRSCLNQQIFYDFHQRVYWKGDQYVGLQIAH